MGRLDRLLDPATIAVVGGDPAARAIEQCERLGFAGKIWPVHPTRSEVGGRRAYSSLDELPAPPDAAFVAVNRDATIGMVRDLAAMGAGGAVLYASGFAEAGPQGAKLQAQLSDGHTMPLIGPNCYGTINAITGAALWPDVHGCRRVMSGPVLLSQSGNIALNMTMNQRGVDFANVVSVGNQASVTIEECIVHFAADPNVSSIGIYMESVADSVAFGHAALVAKDHQTPLVVLKTGRSATAESIALTHTAAMSTPADAYNALFERYGILTVDSLPELMSTLALLHAVGPLSGNRLISLSCSGGEASLVADLASEYDVVFEPLTDDHASRLRATLSDLVAITNPLDYHTFIWGDRAALTRCFTEALDGPVDAAMLVLDWPRDSRDDIAWWPTLEAIEAASSVTGTKAIVVASLAENLPEKVRAHLHANHLGAASTIDEALAGLANCAAAGRWLNSRPAELHLPQSEPPGRTRSIGEAESKEILAEAGVTIPGGMVIGPDDLRPELAYPAVAKITGSDHKADSNGVILDIAGPAEMGAAVSRLRALSERVLVESMVTGGVAELLLAVRRQLVGVTCTLGVGGTMAELLDDTVTVLLPETDDRIERALKATRLGRLLGGHRSAPAVDLRPVTRVISHLAELIVSRPDIVEVEINPLVVTATEAVAADALIVLERHP